jgi:beta-glucanase (GH16 family)
MKLVLLGGRNGVAVICATALTASVLSGTRPTPDAEASWRAERSAATWALTWSDEFDAANGSRPDPAKWKFAIGGNGWGNNELQYYTDRAENSRIEDGKLVIEARGEDYEGKDGVTRQYTSARLTTRGTFSQAYGRFTARIKLPRGAGMWPAFWLMGDTAELHWPDCGEIDIMENIGREPASVHGSMHGPGYSGVLDFTSTYKLAGGPKFHDDFHEFAIEWEPNAVRFYTDEYLYATFVPAQLPVGKKWVFDHPFYIILNLAVGGDWPGPPDATTEFPQQMLVDYVRVYKEGSDARARRGIEIFGPWEKAGPPDDTRVVRHGYVRHMLEGGPAPASTPYAIDNAGRER